MERNTHLKIVPSVLEQGLELFLERIADSDFETPVKRCGSLLRHAEFEGYVRLNKPLTAKGEESKRPVTLTPKGRSLVRKHLGANVGV